jgi:hypothetical protein
MRTPVCFTIHVKLTVEAEPALEMKASKMKYLRRATLRVRRQLTTSVS